MSSVNSGPSTNSAGPSRRGFLWTSGVVALSSSAGLGTLLSACATAKPNTSSGAQTQKISVALSTPVDIIDPQQFRNDTAYIVTNELYSALLLDNLVKRNGLLDTVSRYTPAMAQSYSYSPDRQTIKFDIRNGLRWQDGSPLTSADYLYSWRRIFEGPGADYLAPLLPLIGVTSVQQLTAPDSHTFVIEREFDSPMFIPFMAFLIFGPMPAVTAKAHATASDPWAGKWFSSHAVSCGPYSLTSYAPEQQISLARNRNFWNPALVANGGVTFSVVPSADSRVSLVEGGSIDAAQDIPFRDASALASNRSVRVYRYPGLDLTYLGFNNASGPFADINLRRAVQLAVPYQALIKDVLYGFGQAADSIVSIGMPGHKSVLASTQNLAGARTALRASAYSGETLTLSVRQSQSDDQSSATFIQSALAGIGMKVSVSVVPDVEFQSNLASGSMPLFIMDWQSLGQDGFYQMTFCCKSDAVTNYTKFSNPKVDALIAQGVPEGNVAARAALLGQAQDTWAAQVPMAPLYQAAHVVLTPANVVGVNDTYDELQQVMYLHSAG